MPNGTQPVQGPDGKLYQFPPGTTKEAAIGYFKKKGIGVKAAAPVKADTSMRAQPKPFTKEWWKQRQINVEQAATEALPSAGATVGSIAGGTAGSAGGPIGTGAGAVAGAGIGGMGGEALKQIIRRALGWGGPSTSAEAAGEIGRAGTTQALVQAPAELMPAAAGPLSRMAEKQYARALAPTTRYMKATTQDIVPGLIERGEVGSLKSLERRAGERAAELRPELGSEYGALEARSPKFPARGAGGKMKAGVTGQLPGVGTQILKDLDTAKSKYMVKDAIGNMHVANKPAVDAIEGVQEVVKKFGANISPSSLRQLKQIFDEPVAHAGGYAGADLATHYTLNAQEAAANSIRKILHNASPNISELDKEISFWLDVQLVTSKTLERQTGQAGGLVKVFGPLAAGGAAELGFHYGGMAGGLEAGIGTAMIVLATKMIRSPLWRTASAVTKDRMARALASGAVGDLSALATRFGIVAQGLSQETEKQPKTEANAP